MRTRPWTMLLMMLAGWLNRHHQDVIEYLKEENKILREKLAKRRMEIRTSRTSFEPSVSSLTTNPRDTASVVSC